ncbi:hypothetical protein [Xylocopilactobacillus apicola]|uniref:Aminotransferase class I/classII domain-containing protein n=1 Tax=Xylocopilactobacillus apicola TaxID=2932184 RepID=A0AAU9DEN9_9LACO|nr:hypothetical protein [Xylocopilactobacillus apicola]BDR58365.1 hypothetical protein XA3_08060 [Xylocopilactobacillus apicola]
MFKEQKKEFMELVELSQKLELLDVLNLPELKSNEYVSNDRKLIDFNEEIRTAWLEKVGRLHASYDKSPYEGEIPKDAFGRSIGYTYEALLDDKLLKNNYSYDITDYNSSTFLYPNGMASIKGTIDAISVLLDEEIDIQFDLEYFESNIYLNTLSKTERLRRGPNKSNIFIFEPINYDFYGSLVKSDDLINAINNSSAKLKFVIVDSTMHNKTEILEQLSKKIKDYKDTVFVDVRSGLKFDEDGLELSNLGIAEWFVHKSQESFFNKLEKILKNYRNITGANLSYISYVSLLYTHSIYDSINYSHGVFNTVKEFMDITGNLNFKNSKIKSSKGDFMGIKIYSPFLFFTMNISEEKECMDFIHRIQAYLSKEGYFLPLRNSWGFRFPSIEPITHYKTREIAIKLYLGKYRGSLFDELIDLFKKISSQGDTGIF